MNTPLLSVPSRLAAALASSALLLACTGDDTNNPLPASDAAAGDATAMTDASADAGVHDASSNDGSKADGSSTDGASGDGATTDGATGDGSPPDGGLVSVQILAFNDFHGNLRPPPPGNAVVVAPPNDPAIGDAGNPTPTDAGVLDGGPLNIALQAGGAAYLSAHIQQLRATNPNTIVVSAGDMTGASPLVSSAYDDEPTINVMNAIGVDYHSVGNHEFDRGPSELLRKQFGGCNTSDRTDAGGSCFADPSFAGANFTYLSANVDTNASTGKTLFPGYVIRTIAGAKIAFIGMTLESTPTIVSASGTAGLAFEDEIATVNALVPQLKAQDVDSIVVLLHQGGFQQGTYNDCVGLTGTTVPSGEHDIVAIADGLDPAVDAIASAHTHIAYNCNRNGRILTQAASYGRVITKIDLEIDTAAHRVVQKAAKNVMVTRDITPDPKVDALVSKYVGLIAPIAERKVGTISADITKLAGPNGEAPLGDAVADAMLAAGQASGAQVAFTNIGGLRDSLLYKQYYSEGDGVVTYEKAQAVLPFGNKVQIATCTGAQIIAAVQQNVFVQAGGGTKVLQVSNGFAYSWATSAADSAGQNAADPASFTIGGAAVNPTASYTVALTDFIGGGGDGYTAFKQCTVTSTLGTDLPAFISYLGANQPLATPAANRITKTN